LADGSYQWYKDHAIRSRRLYKTTETLQLIVASAIPLAAAISPHNAIAPAALGATVAALTGTRGIFHWQEDYLRFSQAREAVEADRRRYNTSAAPYADPTTRDQNLAGAVTRIEQDEMSGWFKVVANPSTQQATPG